MPKIEFNEDYDRNREKECTLKIYDNIDNI